MLPPLPVDHRRSDDRRLLASLRRFDALALAELFNRTVAAAHTGARRLLADAGEVEALLTQVYADLWTEGPEEDESPEGWVRRRCFALASAHLLERGRPPASPSAALLLPGLARAGHPPAQRSPGPQVVDDAEGQLAGLPAPARMALLRAHDAGIPSAQQRAWVPAGASAEENPTAALAAALRVLGGSASGEQAPTSAAAAGCDDLPLADWVLGLLDVTESEEVAAAVKARPPCAEEVRLLRRARARLEGPPPPPELGPRVVAAVLSGAAASQQLARRPTTVAAPGAAVAATHERVAATHAEAVADVSTSAGDPAALATAATAPRTEPVQDSAGRRAVRTALGLLLLLLGAAIGLYVGQAIVATL